MLAGISITCFAASYLVALLLEVSRLFFRSGVRRAVTVGFVGAGLVAHTLYLAYRAATATGTPLSSEFDWYLVAAWCLAVVYLYLTLEHPQTAFGLFVLPLVLGLIGMAHFFSDPTPYAQTQAAKVWGTIHGAFLLLGTVAVAVGFAGGLMGLVQAYRLKRKLPPLQGLRLPSLEWLERTNIRATAFSVVMLAIGFFSGIVLNLVHHRLKVEELPWNDPIIWGSGLLLAWLVVAALFTVCYKPARQGRKVAYLTVASFVFLVLSIGIRVFLPTSHGRAAEDARHVEPGGASSIDDSTADRGVA
jgi:ABC-type uncharacterized transport system permease subunit